MIDRKWRRLQIATLGAIVMSAAMPALSAMAGPSGRSWNASFVPYKVNLDTFSSAVLNGLGLTTNQAAFWARETLEIWRWRTGADIDFSYNGDTNLGDNESDCYMTHHDSTTDFLAAEPVCIHDDLGATNCAVLALTTVSASGSTIVGAATCIAGQKTNPTGVNWEIDADGFGAGGGETDLASVMTHEWGHFLGADHNTAHLSVMYPTISKDIKVRYPTDDDVPVMRTMYPPSGQYTVKYSSVSGTTLGVATTTNTSSWPAQGAVLVPGSGSNQYVIYSKPTGSTVEFYRSALPLGLGWTAKSYSLAGGPESKTGSWSEPGLTYGNGYVLAAYPNRVSSISLCSGIRVLRTTNLFDSATSVDLDDCTFGAVSVTWVDSLSTFVLFYHRWSKTAGGTSDRIWARTSPDGVNWYPAVDTGVRSTHPPSAAGGNLIYASSASSPIIVSNSYVLTRPIGSTDWTGVTLGTSPTTYANRAYIPAAAGAAYDKYLAMFWDENYSGTRVEFDTSVPITPWDDLAYVGPRDTPAFAGTQLSSTGFLIWAE